MTEHPRHIVSCSMGKDSLATRQFDSAGLYAVLYDTIAMSDQEILSLGFELPQCAGPEPETQNHKEQRRNPMKDKYIQTAEAVTEGHPDKRRCREAAQ